MSWSRFLEKHIVDEITGKVYIDDGYVPMGSYHAGLSTNPNINSSTDTMATINHPGNKTKDEDNISMQEQQRGTTNQYGLMINMGFWPNYQPLPPHNNSHTEAAHMVIESSHPSNITTKPYLKPLKRSAEFEIITDDNNDNPDAMNIDNDKLTTPLQKRQQYK